MYPSARELAVQEELGAVRAQQSEAELREGLSRLDELGATIQEMALRVRRLEEQVAAQPPPAPPKDSLQSLFGQLLGNKTVMSKIVDRAISTRDELLSHGHLPPRPRLLADSQIVVVTTGRFELLTAQDVRHLAKCRAAGAELLVIVQEPTADKRVVLEAMRSVDQVYDSVDMAGSVAQSLEGVIDLFDAEQQIVFVKGLGGAPEDLEAVCEDLGVDIVDVYADPAHDGEENEASGGGEKVQDSIEVVD